MKFNRTRRATKAESLQPIVADNPRISSRVVSQPEPPKPPRQHVYPAPPAQLNDPTRSLSRGIVKAAWILAIVPPVVAVLILWIAYQVILANMDARMSKARADAEHQLQQVQAVETTRETRARLAELNAEIENQLRAVRQLDRSRPARGSALPLQSVNAR